MMSSINQKLVDHLRSAFRTVSTRKLATSFSISQSEYADRRLRLADTLGYAIGQQSVNHSRHLVLLPAAEIQYMAFHVPYPFRQDSNFYYFTGLNEPNALLALDINVEPEGNKYTNIKYTEHLFMTVPSAREEIWNGPGLGISDAIEVTGIRSIYDLTSLSSFLETNGRHAYIWYPPLVQPMAEQQTPNQFVLSQVLKFKRLSDKPTCDLRNPLPLIDRLRFIKSTSEIQLLQHAARITVECMEQLMLASLPGINESALATLMLFEANHRGCSLGYPSVVAGGVRANTIHYLKNNQVIEDGDMVLVDAGCSYHGYTADLSRTWPINGHYDPKQRILHEILEETQNICAKRASPETSLQYLHGLMLSELARHLLDQRILVCSDDDVNGAIEKICPHSIGHYLGLDVHDTPTVMHSQPLQPGVVFPLEPGVYMRPSLGEIGIRPEFLGLGLRLEDDFVMGDDGVAKRLTNRLPTAADQIESIVQQGRTATSYSSVNR